MNTSMVYRCISQIYFCMQLVWSLDEVMFINPPIDVLPNYELEIFYSCGQPATIQLECIVSFEKGTISTLLLNKWTCVPGYPDTRIVKLKLPDWLVYQADGIVPESHDVLSCFLRASVKYRELGHSESPIIAQDVAAMQLRPFFSRPVKQHQLCFTWSKQMLQLTNRDHLQKQCPYEQETVHLLSTIYASTGERFGVTKTLTPYKAELLEHHRLKAISFPWCTLSIWIFLTSSCPESLCGIFYHIDPDNNYATPTVLLTNSDQLHIQISGESKETSAFLSSFKVPLHEWCQLSLTLQGRSVTISMMCVAQQRTFKSTEYMLEHDDVLDDTKGYFVIGGGKYAQGVKGYFGPVTYHRNRASLPIQIDVLPEVIRNANLSIWIKTCEEFSFEMKEKICGFSLMVEQGTQSESCLDVFHEWMLNTKIQKNPRCELWETPVPHRRRVSKLAEFLVYKYGKAVSLPAVGRALYSLSLHKLGRASSTAGVSKIIPMLLQAGCLGEHRALYMSSVILHTGLGVQKRHNKAWLLALLAAQEDDRLSLLHLGHLHHQGLYNLPADPDVAYAYYANIAKQTTVDQSNPTPNQTFVEAIYLNNEEVLNLQTNEDHHIFQWLKLQAHKGTAEAEQALARMLFWGQQGLSPKIEEAVKHYRRGAVLLKNPVSMYDYGILLIQGRGVEKDIPKGVSFLKKAAEQDFVPAINALGWYYEQFEHDYKKAVQLWEKADLLGSPDAAFNLGVMYSGGLYPGKPANQVVAYQYFLKSAHRAHLKGAVQIAETWTTGMPGYVSRNPSDAVLWVKWAAEHNGYLGSILRKALDSYLKKDMFVSLLFYMMAAESGYTAAQFNVAYICEQNVEAFLDPTYAVHCMWTYYNLAIQNQDPDSYAFIKLGDLLYEGFGGRQRNLFSAAEMYTKAALKNNSQGWYKLGALSEDGYRLPLAILTEIGLSELFLEENYLFTNSFYKRCRDSGDEDAYLPCSLALFNLFLKSMQDDYRATIKFFMTFFVVVATTMLIIILGRHGRRALSTT